MRCRQSLALEGCFWDCTNEMRERVQAGNRFRVISCWEKRLVEKEEIYCGE